MRATVISDAPYCPETKAGGHIVLGVLGVMHPPILMQVAATDGKVVQEGVRQ